MKSNKKRGFTLVELLVVIAILAILATVSVVGYTSFIERATVSNDENVASQLNQFLIALKADSNSEYYQVKIDETNVREITRYILRESGLDELEPQSEKYGYHFYFDLANQKYVLAADRDVTSSLATRMFAHAEGEKYFLGSCFTDGNYFLADTKGDLAEVINAIYTATNGDEINSAIALVDTIEDASIKEVVDTFVNSSVIVTSERNYRVVDNPTNVIFTDNTSVVRTDTSRKNGNTWTPVPVDEQYKLANTDKVVLPNSVECVTENSLNINTTGTVVINKTPEQVGEMAYAPFTNVNVSIDEVEFSFSNDGNFMVSVTVNVNVQVELTYSNPLDSFTASVNNDANNKIKYDANTNTAYVAWELGQFELILDTVAENAELPATDVDITWAIKENGGSGVEFDGNIVKFKNGVVPSDDIVIVGTNATPDSEGNPITFDLNIKVGRATAAPLTLAGKSLNTFNKIYLVHGGNTNAHNVVLGNISLNDAGQNLSLDTTFDVSYSGSGITVSDNVITTTGAGNGTLTIKIGKYLTHTIDVVVFDKSGLPIEAKTNVVVLGQGSDTAPIYISDLFTAKDASKIPNDAEIRFTVSYGDDKYVEFNRNYIDYVKDSAGNSITTLPWSNTAGFYFSSLSGDSEIAIAVYAKDGTRISDDVNVKIISAANVRDWNAISGGISANTVLLSNIVFPNNAQLAITGGTFYGNDFVFDVRNAKKDAAEHIISLKNATIDGLNIIGKVYTTFKYQDHYASGTVDSTSIVVSNGGTIRNCYIANGRAPVRVIGNTTIQDSIIFGGKYCNIDVAVGILTLAGNVTTINQLYEGQRGGGIVCDLTRETNYVNVGTCKLVQYNFVPKSAGSALPTISITMKLGSYQSTISVPMGNMVNKLITDSQYSEWVFNTKDANGNVTESYLNAGIVYLTADGFGASAVSTDNRGSGSVPVDYKMATYTETYHPGPDWLGFTTHANAHVYSPVSQNQTFAGWFANATNAEYMKQYLPTNYVEGAMK